jgi:hypothetical protein
MTKVHKFFLLSFRRKWLLCEAVIGLSIVKVLSKILPFRWFARLFGRQEDERTSGNAPIPEGMMEICWAIRTAERIVPWGKKCLVKALAGKLMARSRGYRATFCLGVGRNEAGELIYHAWLRYCHATIIGGKTEGVYKILGEFN